MSSSTLEALTGATVSNAVEVSSAGFADSWQSRHALRYALVIAVFVGCYSPGYRDCEITCVSGTCPSGLTPGSVVALSHLHVNQQTWQCLDLTSLSPMALATPTVGLHARGTSAAFDFIYVVDIP